MNDVQRLACAMAALVRKAAPPMQRTGARAVDPLLTRLASATMPASPHDVAATVTRHGLVYTVRAIAGGPAKETGSLADALATARALAAGAPIMVRGVTGQDMQHTGATWCAAGVVGNSAFLTL
jgi:hypothetical protein